MIKKRLQQCKEFLKTENKDNIKKLESRLSKENCSSDTG
jgi:hypothetical protein